MDYFIYGEVEMSYLKSRDRRLGEAVDHLGVIYRKVQPDLFCALIESMVGQQISSKSQATILSRMYSQLGTLTPYNISVLTVEEIQRFGMSTRKAEYILNAAFEALSGALDLGELSTLRDMEVSKRLSSLKGVGTWTAEMLMLFSMQRPDILSFGDYAILRGMRTLYRKKEITREQFEKYRKRYSPYGSVASIYLWAISSGAVPWIKEAPSNKTK